MQLTFRRFSEILGGLTVTFVTMQPICAQDPPQPGADTCGLRGADNHAHASFPKNLVEKFNAYETQDRRARDLHADLARGVECLNLRLRDLATRAETHAQAVHQDQDSIKSSIQAISQQLQSVTSGVHADRIRVDTGLPIKTWGAPEGRSDPAVAQYLKALTQIQDGEQRLFQTLDADLQAWESRIDPSPVVSNKIVVTVPSPQTPAEKPARDQINPTSDVLSHYLSAKVTAELAIAVVPDPRVPRHRRQYDNAITAITQGMLESGYVLDLYAFPWRTDVSDQGALSTNNAVFTALKSLSSDAASTPNVENDNHFGLMLFRKDSWRENGNPSAVAIRAVYVIPETGTYGVQPLAFRDAVLRINDQLGKAPKLSTQVVKLFTHRSCAPGPGQGDAPTASVNGRSKLPPASELTVFGPTFSGSLDSILEVVSGLRPDPGLPNIPSICLLSSSATATSNAKADGDLTVQSQPPALHYRSLATPDDIKLKFIDQLRVYLGLGPTEVAIVFEATVFGKEICRVKTDEPCKSAQQYAFPVNIADVRFGLKQQEIERQKRNATDKSSNRQLHIDDDRLPLEDGAENGSEFPESQESPLTAASTELILDEMFEGLGDAKPKLVVIVATDVRDRLFLIAKIGSRLRNALFVDLGADRLLGHADFINATRGTLALSTSDLTTRYCEGFQTCVVKDGKSPPAALSVWSTDEQALLFQAIRAWRDDHDWTQFSPCDHSHPTFQDCIKPHLVTRTGLRSSDLSFGSRRDDSLWGLLFLGTFGIAVILVVKYRATLAFQPKRATAVKAALAVVSVIAAIALSYFYSQAFGINPTKLGFLVALAGVIVAWPLVAGLRWPLVMSWSGLLFLVGIGLLELLHIFPGLIQKKAPNAGLSPLTTLLSPGLSDEPSTGLDYPLALAVACIAILLCTWIGLCAGSALARSNFVLGGVPSADGDAAESGVDSLDSPLSKAGGLLLVVGAFWVGLHILLFWYSGWHRITVFGSFADFCAYAALLATTTLQLGMVAGTVGIGARVQSLSGFMRARIFDLLHLDLADDAKDVLVWGNRSGPCPDFASTPVLAYARGAANWITDYKRRKNRKDYQTSLRVALTSPVASRTELGSLVALLTDEMHAYRLTVAGFVLCAIASSVIVYLFPVSNATALILTNMALLLVGGAYAAFTALGFERDLILSSVLCNRKRELEWSWKLFLTMLTPFVALALIVGIVQIPGVADAGGSVLDLLVGAIKPGAK